MTQSTSIFKTYPKGGVIYRYWRRILKQVNNGKPTKGFLDPEVTLPKLASMHQPGTFIVYVGDILGKEYLDIDTLLVCKDQRFRYIDRCVNGKGLRWVLASSRHKGTYYASVRFCRRTPKYISGSEDKLDVHFKAMRYFIDKMIENREIALNQDVMQNVIDAWEYHYENRIPIYYKKNERKTEQVKEDKEYMERVEVSMTIYNKLLTAKSFSEALA